MKKIAIFIMMVLGVQSLIAQDRYTVTLNLSLLTKTNHMECDTYVDVTLFLSDGTSIFQQFVVPGEVNDGVTYTFSPMTITTSSYVTSIKCEGHQRDNPTGPVGCHEIGSGTSTVYASVSEYPCISNKTVTSNFMGKYDNGSELRVDIIPISPSISYSANGISFPNGAPMLPDTKKVLLSATGGYISSVYHWKYKTSDAYTWNDFPASFQGVSSIEFTGNNLFSDFRQLIVNGQNVQIQIDYGCGQSNIVTLTPLLVAPEISDATGINTTCGRNDNGQIKIKYSRPLYEGEYLNFKVNNQSSSDTYSFLYGWNDPNIVKDLANQEIIIKNLNIGAYTVRLLSYLNDDTHVLYSDESGDFSRQNVTIAMGNDGPVKATNIKTTDILCKGNETGTLSMSATGGSGTYHIELHKAMENDIFKQSESFVTGEKDTITGLPAGSYDAYIVDASGCISDYIPVDIYEPDYPFTIETVSTTKATFNENYEEENNGSIQISVSDEGSPFTYVWKEGDANGAILLSQEDEYSNTSTLENINSGSYYVNITNANGCSADTVIVVQRSPNVSFSIQQTGNIACSGDNTG